ncbi:MAG TPA: D-alanyl-D-alanine carboxypeptidase/D-alanyl-D-alanine-endopeptidase [Methylophilaceae bacterium]|nr:D-alanyl-D-alanine carboxypeptidase/D-alanyl-D-alanine-endopeptidase [Methylophilaceae bacterium]
MMLHRLLLPWLAALLWALPAHAELPVPVSEALSRAGIPQENVAVYVQQVDSAQPLISHYADQAYSPASVMKLLTTYAALDMLGPAYRWQTEVFRDGPLQHGVLDGNLIIKGHGDPYFRTEDFWQLLTYLRQSGIRQINGNLVLDDSFFAPLAEDPGAFDGEPYRAYNALPDALLVNFKATSFRLVPDSDGHKVNIYPNPDVAEIQVDNRLKLTEGGCGDWKHRLQYAVEPVAEGDGSAKTDRVRIHFTGSYAQDCGEKALELSLLNDGGYAYSLFRKLWQELGGTFNGGLQHGPMLQDAVLLAQYQSPPLAEIVRSINKYSNNLMTRQLLLTLGAEYNGVPGTEAGGETAIHQWLSNKQMDFPELVMENGSGLSRIARISAAHLSWLLLDAYRSPVMPELMSSLPIPAVDGTLKSRLKDSGVAGRAHIKTGSLEGVRSIAGYVLDHDGRRWAVVFLVNHPLAWKAADAQDALIDWVYDHDETAGHGSPRHCCHH